MTLTASLLYLSLINTYNVEPDTANTLVCIAYHESKFNTKTISPKNRNGTRDYGLFQINSLWLKELKLTKQQLLNKTTNTYVALHILKVQGFSAWVTYKRCK